MENRDALAITADFLAYPGPSTVGLLGLRANEIASANRSVSKQLNAFVEFARSQPLARLQELFTQTFDLNPVCSLEVGWHLYGEDYRRGRFLAAMRRLLSENGVVESCELPDHLTHMLPLLTRLQADEAERLGREYVGRAVKKMVDALEAQQSPFLPILLSIQSLLVACWGPNPEGIPAETPGGQELEVAP